MENKIDIRNKAKKIRQTLDIKGLSAKIIQHIHELIVYKNAKNIMIFYPLENEINLLDLLKLNSEKFFFLPRMNGNTLDACSYSINDKLTPSKYNILEPLTAPVNKNIIDIVFIPALCTDKNLNRLGYGKGFYDKFLSDYKNLKICVCPEELLFNKIPTDAHDIKMDLIITQNTIYKK